MSAEPGLSRPADIPALKALWKQAFGDTDRTIDALLLTLYAPEQVFVLREAGQVQAMACWLPETICWAQKGWRAAYLYAVATDMQARGRGYCGRLLAYAGGWLEPHGVKAMLLVPGSSSLRQFYRRHGYEDFTTLQVESFPRQEADGTAEAVPVPVYLELREQFLSGRAYVSCPVPVLSFQEAIARESGGGLFRLHQGQQEGCACVALDPEGKAILHELLWPGDRRQGASLAAAAVGASQILSRSPGGSEPFAMARWLAGKPKLPAPYLGIALD